MLRSDKARFARALESWVGYRAVLTDDAVDRFGGVDADVDVGEGDITLTQFHDPADAYEDFVAHLAREGFRVTVERE